MQKQFIFPEAKYTEGGNMADIIYDGKKVGYYKSQEDHNTYGGGDCSVSQDQKQGGKEYIDYPPHYTRGKIEVIEFIEDQKLGFHLGNVIKYVCRAGYKETTEVVDDLRKARNYLDKKIAQIIREDDEQKEQLGKASGYSSCTEDIN
jgi:hypothetical protein